ncbi:MAG: cobalamin-dependent protein [Magnetococcales bacterium]|nr:cobalamin-dependent protein [Magnetococcales bacterium]
MTESPPKVSFADLTHTGRSVAANMFPLGLGFVAAYARKHLARDFSFELFRYPEDFNAALRQEFPRVACFSAYAWNLELSYGYARLIKKYSPSTVTIFGGVNFPIDPVEQCSFLRHYPAIDFFVEGEGEEALVGLLAKLADHNFSGHSLRRTGEGIPSVRYVQEESWVTAPMLPRIDDLERIPSPYLTGIMDKFFDARLTPLLQFTRGCPYSCVFCHEAPPYYNKIRQFSLDRIREELEYVASRSQVLDLCLADLNFGILEQDVAIARELVGMRERYGWPQHVDATFDKNNKKHALEIFDIMRGLLPRSMAVQSTDPKVLAAIRRRNPPLELLSRTAHADRRLTTANQEELVLSEIIVALPEDTRTAHERSVADMLDLGVTLLKNHQFMVLKGTLADTEAFRQKYAYDTRFRVMARCCGYYPFLGENFPAAEIEEICVGTRSMRYADYQWSRWLSLSVEIFNNDLMFAEIAQFMQGLGLRPSQWFHLLHEQVLADRGALHDLYQAFHREEEGNLWPSRQEIHRFLLDPGTIDRYITGDLGYNEIYKYKVLALFDHMDELHALVRRAANIVLAKRSVSELERIYLDELLDLSLLRKDHFFDADNVPLKARFHFNFVRGIQHRFRVPVTDLHVPPGIDLEVYHDAYQKNLIRGLTRQYGTTLTSRARIIRIGITNKLFRQVRVDQQTFRFPSPHLPLMVPYQSESEAVVLPGMS